MNTPLYFVGIDISKYKHDCRIISTADQKVVAKFTFKSDKTNFEQLLVSLNSLSNPEDIKIGFESTAHYTLNLELFLENAHHSLMEVNPVLIKDYKKSTTLRRIKTDFSIQQFLRLKELAANTVGVNNSTFNIELNSLLTLYKSLVKEIDTLEAEILKLIEEVHPHYLTIPGIGPISAAVIYTEYGDISNFSNPGQMLAFAGIKPGITS